MYNPASYAATKAGMINFTKWLSKVLSPKVRVNCISPGGIFQKPTKEVRKSVFKKTALNRMAKENDFVGIIALLSSDASSYITGQNIIVDGGWGLNLISYENFSYWFCRIHWISCIKKISRKRS